MPPKVPSVIKCESGASLESELNSVRSSISLLETEESWSSIERGIQLLVSLLRGCACEFPSELVSALRSLSRPILCSLNSERSRLSGAAIDMMGTAACELGPAFEPLIPIFFSSVLALCARSSKLWVSRARTCVASVIENTRSPSLLSYLLDSLRDKSATLRLAAIEGVLACLNCFNPPDLEKESRAKEVEAAIKVTATDASADVRKVSKKVYEAYAILLPHRVDSFTQPLTPTIKKYLNIASERVKSSTSQPSSRPHSSQSCRSVANEHRPKSSHSVGVATATDASATTRTRTVSTYVPSTQITSTRPNKAAEPFTEADVLGEKREVRKAAHAMRKMDTAETRSTTTEQRSDSAPKATSRPIRPTSSSTATKELVDGRPTLSTRPQRPTSRNDNATSTSTTATTVPVPTTALGQAQRPARPLPKSVAPVPVPATSAVMRPAVSSRSTEANKDGPVRPMLAGPGKTQNEDRVGGHAVRERVFSGPRRVPLPPVPPKMEREPKLTSHDASQAVGSSSTLKTSTFSKLHGIIDGVPGKAPGNNLPRVHSKGKEESRPAAQTKTGASNQSKFPTSKASHKPTLPLAVPSKPAPQRAAARQNRINQPTASQLARIKKPVATATEKTAPQPTWGRSLPVKGSHAAKVQSAKIKELKKGQNTHVKPRVKARTSVHKAESKPAPASAIPKTDKAPPTSIVARGALPTLVTTPVDHDQELGGQLQETKRNQTGDETGGSKVDPAVVAGAERQHGEQNEENTERGYDVRDKDSDPQVDKAPEEAEEQRVTARDDTGEVEGAHPAVMAAAHEEHEQCDSGDRHGEEASKSKHDIDIAAVQETANPFKSPGKAITHMTSDTIARPLPATNSIFEDMGPRSGLSTPPRTPISALVKSIQQGFIFSPYTPLSPSESYKLGSYANAAKPIPMGALDTPEESSEGHLFGLTERPMLSKKHQEGASGFDEPNAFEERSTRAALTEVNN